MLIYWKMGPTHVETVKSVLVESSDEKNDCGVHWQFVEPSGKNKNMIAESTDKQWHPATFCFNYSKSNAKKHLSTESRTKHAWAFVSKILIVTGIRTAFRWLISNFSSNICLSITSDFRLQRIFKISRKPTQIIRILGTLYAKSKPLQKHPNLAS